MANREVIEKWVAALESGEYQQTRGTLHRVQEGDNSTVGFCCLGVLCDLAVKEGIVSEMPERKYGKVWYDIDGIFAESSELPPSVAEWAGLSEENPLVGYELTPEEFEASDFDMELDGPAREDTLANMNDSYNFDFKRIAQVIRDNFLPKES